MTETAFPNGSIWTARAPNRCVGVFVTDKTALFHYKIMRAGWVKKGFSEHIPLDPYPNCIVVQYRGCYNPMRWFALQVLLLTLRLRLGLPSDRILFEV